MQIILRDIGKRFHQKWVFKGQNMQFESGQHYAVTGKNGSGKSTLMLITAGYLSPTTGSVHWNEKGKPLAPDSVYSKLSLASPYLELVEEFTLEETLVFHQKFKPFHEGFHLKRLIDLSGLSESRHKALRHFSSGMKQRVKLLLAIMSRSQLVLLDEPCANLDSDAVAWYQQLKDDYGKNRTFVICSNHNPEEYPGVSQVFGI
ncbi:MAG: ATP-binding cassette domain-containing protein [Bacteroidales bacterium]|nr:ATP-binding cassette domain-containing protein [Bacteroidales bacterium]